MTRPGKNRRAAGGGSANSNSRRAGSLGRSSLWSDDEGPDDGRKPQRAQVQTADSGPRPTGSRARSPQRRHSGLRWFLRRYGWRAYALPVLVALTVLVALQVGRSSTPDSVAAARPLPSVASAVGATIPASTVPPATTATAQSALPPVVPTAGSTTGSTARSAGSTSPAAPVVTASTAATGAAVGRVPTGTFQGLAAAALPPGEAFVAKGRGTWHLVKGTSALMGTGGAKYTFSIEVEDGVQNAAADQDFAAVVDAALADPRSWIGSGRFQLQRVDTGTPSFRISLTSQLTVRENTLCGWEIHYEASCYARSVNRVAINDARWARGAVSFNGDRGSYRVYAINHEVGHALGFGHQPCATTGGLAPVMMQQSWSTANNDLSPLNPQLIPMDGKVCTFNPFPYPLGALIGGAAPVGG